MRLHDVMIHGDSSLREALQRIDAGGIQLAIVVDADDKLVGTVSDGDIRRGLLRGLTLESRVRECTNEKPMSVPAGTDDAEILRILRRSHLHQMPVIDAAGRVVDLKVLDDLIDVPDRPNLVVMMVGGLGERLGSLTRDVPKPMLPVGGRPLLETIIGTLCDQGFRRIRLAVNFRGDVIERHFGDGSRFNCEIEYLRETKRMGTAGALSLLPQVPEHPVLVSNGDLLLRLDYRSLIDHHVASGVEATMAVRDYEYQVPYGVVRTAGDDIVALEEKPLQRCLISGGLYVLSPSAVRRVPPDTFYDMPTLFSNVIQGGGRASVFRIDGYWLDIGRFADYEQAQREFSTVFNPE